MKPIDFDLVTTRTGDNGRTSDYSGTVDWKDSPLFDLLGDLDELSSWLGMVKHQGAHRGQLEIVQTRLLNIGSLVATDPASPLFTTLRPVSAADVDMLELWEHTLFNTGVVIRPVFVLPGGTPGSAPIDVARAVCRRTERRMVAFVRDRPRPDLKDASRYLNRLSDALFVLARSLE